MLPRKVLYQKDNVEQYNVKCTITDGRYLKASMFVLLNKLQI